MPTIEFQRTDSVSISGLPNSIGIDGMSMAGWIFMAKSTGWHVEQKTIKTVQTEEIQVLLNYLEMKNKSFYNVNNICWTFQQI